MKRLKPSMFLKTLSFVLCILFFMVTLVCALCAASFLERNFYYQPEDYYESQLPENLFQKDAQHIMRYYLSTIRPLHLNIVPQIDDASPYRLSNTNLHYQLIGPTDYLLLCNDSTLPYDVHNAPLIYSFKLEQGKLINKGPQYSNFCYNLIAYVDTDYPVLDHYFMQDLRTQYGYSLRYIVLLIGIASLALFFFFFIMSLSLAGRKPNQDCPAPGVFRRIPSEFWLLGSGIFFAVFIFLSLETYHSLCSFFEMSLDIYPSIWSLFLCFLCSVFLLLGINEVAVRIKTHTLLTNSLFYPLSRSLRIKLGKLSQSFRSIFTRLPLVGKSIVFLLLITAIELIFLFACQQNFTLLMICWIMEKFFLVPVIIYISICLQTLQKAGNAIASGDLSYKTNTDYLILDFKEYAIQLNNIGVGMSAAVEKRLQSERMKTELITNISHDIKTPITSLINYAGLIASTPCDSPVHAEYAEVLTRKSERLKHLLEDLVEISKATSGNLELELLPCKADILLSQAAGEYETRLQDANLTLILQQPDEELSILADSKRIWRIFDNLLNNVAKYAMPGTRVFLSLEKREGNAVFTLRNISRDQLTVSPQELLERFTRGESSRTTDGNGLGLSIVSTLTERMGGTMQLDIDGDLFKVTLSFPLHQETEE